AEADDELLAREVAEPGNLVPKPSARRHRPRSPGLRVLVIGHDDEIVDDLGQLRQGVSAVAGGNALCEQEAIWMQPGSELSDELHHLIAIDSRQTFEVEIHAGEAVLAKVAMDIVDQVGACL